MSRSFLPNPSVVPSVALSVLALTALLAGAGCSSSDPPASDAGPGTDGPARETTPPDMMVDVAAEVTFETGGPGTGAPMVCLDIRNCVVRCLEDAACAQRCADTAPAAARTAYQAVVTCSRAGCADDDRPCRCSRECLEPGECVSVVDDCRAGGGEDDTFCDELCH